MRSLTACNTAKVKALTSAENERAGKDQLNNELALLIGMDGLDQLFNIYYFLLDIIESEKDRVCTFNWAATSRSQLELEIEREREREREVYYDSDRMHSQTIAVMEQLYTQ